LQAGSSANDCHNGPITAQAKAAGNGQQVENGRHQGTDHG